MKANDFVLHKPTGEKWVVCGVDPERDLLVPCGYPIPSIAKMSDCEVFKERNSAEGQPEEYKEALRKHGLDRFIEK